MGAARREPRWGMESVTLERLVRPRVLDPLSGGGEPVLLEDALARRAERREHGPVRLEGPPGSGKRTALAFVRLHFAGDERIAIEGEPAERAEVVVGVFAGQAFPLPSRLALVPWTRDEWIEYLLANQRAGCTCVMARLEAPERYLALNGRPLLWAAVLDELARDEALTDDLSALRRALRNAAGDRLERARALALELVRNPEDPTPRTDLAHLGRDVPRLEALLQQESVELLLAAEGVAQSLDEPDPSARLPRRLAPALLRVIGPILREQPRARAALASCLEGSSPDGHASAASLLHRCGAEELAAALRALRERGRTLPRLTGAVLPGLTAPGLDLGHAQLERADLRRARLERADLGSARLAGADFTGAALVGARLTDVHAERARFVGADLRAGRLEGARLARADLGECRLEGALLRGASLEQADLVGALLDGADLRAAVLRGARLERASLLGADLGRASLDGLDLRAVRLAGCSLREASLVGCHLEGLALEQLDLARADLTSALLTATVFERADLSGACLWYAGLADVRWRGVNLSGADLSHASFQLGSTRSGLVLGAPAGWGTLTGFYTDETTEPSFQAPEEIRKADLCEADLRGAKILDTDFYLVDLRGARYTPEQERHLRACNAIL